MTAILGLYQTPKAYRLATTSAQAAQTEVALSARRFGTWTSLSAIISLYAVFKMDNSVVYTLALWTYVIASAHFAAERVVLGGRTGGRAIGLSFAWMVIQGWLL